MVLFRLASVLTAVFLAVTLVISIASPAGAQQVVKRTISGPVCMIPGLGAVVTEDSGKVKVMMVPPTEQRPDEYRRVDVEEGDVIIMFNGKRIADVSAFQSRLDSIAVGGEIKLGIQRGSERRIVAFAKADEAVSGGAHMMVMTSTDGQAPTGGVSGMYSDSSGGPAVTVAGEAGLLLGDSDSGLYVIQLLPNLPDTTDAKPVKGGYLVVAVQDVPVRTVAEFNASYDTLKPGDKFKVSFKHGADTFTNSYVRTGARPMIQMKTR
jgi:S1-C subfamily serine protease